MIVLESMSSAERIDLAIRLGEAAAKAHGTSCDELGSAYVAMAMLLLGVVNEEEGAK